MSPAASQLEKPTSHGAPGAPLAAGPRAKDKPREHAAALWFKRFMYFPAIGGNFVPLIQAWDIVRLNSSGSVSLTGFSFALFCIVCWLIYGLIQRDKVLIWANVIGVINLVILIACILIFA